MGMHSAGTTSARPLAAVRRHVTTSLAFATAGALIATAPAIMPQLTDREMQVVADTQRALSHAETTLLAAEQSLFDGLPGSDALGELQAFLAAAGPQGVDSLQAPDIGGLISYLWEGFKPRLRIFQGIVQTLGQGFSFQPDPGLKYEQIWTASFTPCTEQQPTPCADTLGERAEEYFTSPIFYFQLLFDLVYAAIFDVASFEEPVFIAQLVTNFVAVPFTIVFGENSFLSFTLESFTRYAFPGLATALAKFLLTDPLMGQLSIPSIYLTSFSKAGTVGLVTATAMWLSEMGFANGKNSIPYGFWRAWGMGYPFDDFYGISSGGSAAFGWFGGLKMMYQGMKAALGYGDAPAPATTCQFPPCWGNDPTPPNPSLLTAAAVAADEPAADERPLARLQDRLADLRPLGGDGLLAGDGPLAGVRPIRNLLDRVGGRDEESDEDVVEALSSLNDEEAGGGAGQGEPDLDDSTLTGGDGNDALGSPDEDVPDPPAADPGDSGDAAA